jgi:hypothetical protein
MEETELQQRLTRLAERSAPPPREALAEVVVTRHSTQRRQAIGITALVAVVAAVVVAVPSLLDGAPSVEPATGVAAPAAADVAVLSGPTRGSLAGDTTFVEAVRALSWTVADDPAAPTAATDPPLDSRDVVFAGDVAGGRWALVTGQDTIQPDPSADSSGVAAVWFTGPAGAPADQLQPATLLGGVDVAGPAALYDASTGALVVVAAPGDEVLLSRRPDVGADASVSRSFAPIPSPDGVAVVALSPAAGSYDEALRYRVTRHGAEVVTLMPDQHRSDWSSWTGPSVTWLGAPLGWTADQVLTNGADHALGITGLSHGQLGFGVVWAGDLPAPGGQPARLQLMSATLPSGASYLEALYSRDTPSGSSVGSWCGADLRPADPPLAEQVFAVQCSGSDPGGSTGTVRSLVLLAPARATTAWLTDTSGARVVAEALVDGLAVVDAPEGLAAVEFLAADGSSVGRTAPMGMAGLEALTATPSRDD